MTSFENKKATLTRVTEEGDNKLHTSHVTTNKHVPTESSYNRGAQANKTSQTHLQNNSKEMSNKEKNRRYSSSSSVDDSRKTLMDAVNSAWGGRAEERRNSSDDIKMSGLYKELTRRPSFLSMVNEEIKEKIPETVFSKNIQGMSLLMRINNYRALVAKKSKSEKASTFKKQISRKLSGGDFFYRASDLAIALDRTRKRIKKEASSERIFPQDRMAKITFLRRNIFEIEKRLKAKIPAKKLEPSKNPEDTTDDRPGTSRFHGDGHALKFFQKFGRIVLILIQWVSVISESHKKTLEEELRSFVDIAAELDESASGSYMDEDGLVFDKNQYKAKKEVEFENQRGAMVSDRVLALGGHRFEGEDENGRVTLLRMRGPNLCFITLSNDVRKTLTTRVEYRTPEMITQVLHGLRALSSLSEYPLQTQEKLCKVAWYTSVSAKRVIVRQGHLPECFYFILSGMAYVKKANLNESTGQTSMSIAARLTKGQSFGEVGLIFNTQRTATVESATEMELLTIAREDFFQIFMNGDNAEEEAEHIKFLREIPIMKFWPIDEIKSEPGSCIIHYFKRGNLITDNIKTSDWIYIVKEGSIEVIKKLRAVKPHSSGQHRQQSHPMCDVVYPHLRLVDAVPRVNTGRRRAETCHVNREVYDSMEHYYNKLRDQEARKDAGSRESVSIKLPKIKLDGALNDSTSRVNEKGRNSERESVDGTVSSTVTFSNPSVKSEKLPGKPGSSKSPFKPTNAKCSKDHFLLPSSSDLRRAFTPSSEYYFKNPDTCRNPEYVFIKMERLGTKGIVGLNWLEFKEESDLYESSPTACLVSKGAEVVMVSKKLFTKHANDKVKMKLRDIVRPYPNDKKLQENLQIQTNWDCYKHNMLSSLSFRRSLTSVG